mmetsp:Transcript_37278/g.114397  ORF Transcript_37278/g.114397 Transcript_37278/m.114397 type:complete len:551 (+) Transcript_37278:582-2234(+)
MARFGRPVAPPLCARGGVAQRLARDAVRRLSAGRGCVPAVHVGLDRPPEGRDGRHAQPRRQHRRHRAGADGAVRDGRAPGRGGRRRLVAAAVPRHGPHRRLPLRRDLRLARRPHLALHLFAAARRLVADDHAHEGHAPRPVHGAKLWVRAVHPARQGRRAGEAVARALEGCDERRRADPRVDGDRVLRALRVVRLRVARVGAGVWAGRELPVLLRPRRGDGHPAGGPRVPGRRRQADAADGPDPDVHPRGVRPLHPARELHQPDGEDRAQRDVRGAAGRDGRRDLGVRPVGGGRVLAAGGPVDRHVPRAHQEHDQPDRRAAPALGRPRLHLGAASVHRRPDQGRAHHQGADAARARHRGVRGAGRGGLPAPGLLRRHPHHGGGGRGHAGHHVGDPARGVDQPGGPRAEPPRGGERDLGVGGRAAVGDRAHHGALDPEDHLRQAAAARDAAGVRAAGARREAGREVAVPHPRVGRRPRLEGHDAAAGARAQGAGAGGCGGRDSPHQRRREWPRRAGADRGDRLFVEHRHHPHRGRDAARRNLARRGAGARD